MGLGMTCGVVMALAILAVAGTVAACCCCGPGVRSQGYWKNHPCDWPVDCIEIGCVWYTKAEAIAYMQSPGQGDKTYTLFNALVAAKLNVEAGNCSYCISDTICKADAWFCKHPLGSDVRGSSDAWKCGEPLYLCLDAYDNGLLCAPPADD
jgi:hypothetical protein